MARDSGPHLLQADTDYLDRLDRGLAGGTLSSEKRVPIIQHYNSEFPLSLRALSPTNIT